MVAGCKWKRFRVGAVEEEKTAEEPTKSSF